MKRDMAAAHDKVLSEGCCRACGTTRNLDPAHIIPRSRLTAKEGSEDPRNIIPLCRRDHDAQHAGRLELLPLLRRDEETYIVSLVGIEEARLRTTRQFSIEEQIDALSKAALTPWKP